MNTTTEEFIPELIEYSADVWRTPDDRFTLILNEPEPDTFVYVLWDGDTRREFIAFNAAASYVRRSY